MKNFYKIPRAQLAVEAIATANAIANGKVSSLSPQQCAELSALLLAEAEALQAADQVAVAKRSESMQATDIAQEQQDLVSKLMSGLKFTLRGAGASPGEYEAIGFTPPAETRRTVRPETPSHTAAYGVNGGVRITFEGNNLSGSVVYQIFAQDTPKGRWELVGATTKQKFFHRGVRPGEFHQYEVKAQASNGTLSAASNTAVVYTNG
jgi:guanyl-specific ribonuclease Sa